MHSGRHAGRRQDEGGDFAGDRRSRGVRGRRGPGDPHLPAGCDGAPYPLYTDRAWQPGSNTAACKRGREHAAPASDCRCGFYAYGDPTWTVAQPPAVRVLAVVAPWGTLEVATRGVRAEHGRLQAVWLHRRVPAHLVDAVRARYPDVEVLRDRDALLQRHPLTALEGYRGPRLAGHARHVVSRLLAVLAALVVLVGCLPADELIVNAPGAVLWTTAVAVVCMTLVAGLGMRSPAVAAAGMVGLGWMLTTTGDGTATVWLTRLPLLAGGLLSAVLWLNLAAVGRPIPRPRQIAVRRVVARIRRHLA